MNEAEMRLWYARNLYELQLKELSQSAQLAEVRQFLYDMMDWTQQGDGEHIYMAMEKALNDVDVTP